MRNILFAFAGLLAAGTAMASPPFVHDLDRRFDQYTWLTTHNAFNTRLTPVPNQTTSIKAQLDSGVRGLMLDLVESAGEIKVCHVVCLFGESTFIAHMNDEIVPFLQANPEAIVTIFFEDYTSKQAFGAALARIPAMADLTFKPDTWPTSQWPTLRQMIAQNQRLLLFNNDNNGDFPVDAGTAHVMRGKAGTVENYWSLGETIFSHDNSCKSRWSDIPLNTQTVDWVGKSWPRLFVMNQFHGIGLDLHARLDNRFDVLRDRVETYCAPAAGKRPNYIAVDHFTAGDGLAYAGVLNQGGIIFYRENDGKGHIVCGVPALSALSFSLKKSNLGCENDDARSAVLVDVKKGMRFYVFDSEDGSKGDDWTVVEVLRDIPGSVTVGTFENYRLDADIWVQPNPRNGLDGKISRVIVEPPPR